MKLVNKTKSQLTILGLTLLINSTSYAFIGGKQANPGQFPEVISFDEISCTAAKISPRRILISAHCVYPGGDTPPWEPGNRLTLLSGANLDSMQRFPVHIRKVSVHPTWITAMNKYHQDRDQVVTLKQVIDLAIIEVEESTDISSGRLHLTALKPEDKIIVGGFGRISNFDTDMSYNYKFAIKKIASANTNSFKVTELDANKKTFSMGAPGDSGGPAFVIGNKGPEIVGVNSYIDGLLELDTNGKVKQIEGQPSLNIVRLDNKAVQKWLLSVLK